MDNNELMSTIGQRIKYIRKLNKLSQKSFAEVLGISQAHISNIEKGADNPSLTLVKFICSKYFINELWLLKGIGTSSVFDNMEDTTTAGVLKKANEFFLMLQSMVNNLDIESQDKLVNSFTFLVSMYSILIETNNSELIETLCSIIDKIEKLMFNTKLIIKHKKNDYKVFLKYTQYSSQQLTDINNLIKKILNDMLESSDLEIEYKFPQ